jgi:hypothetical protein
LSGFPGATPRFAERIFAAMPLPITGFERGAQFGRDDGSIALRLTEAPGGEVCARGGVDLAACEPAGECEQFVRVNDDLVVDKALRVRTRQEFRDLGFEVIEAGDHLVLRHRADPLVVLAAKYRNADQHPCPLSRSDRANLATQRAGVLLALGLALAIASILLQLAARALPAGDELRAPAAVSRAAGAFLSSGATP